MKGGIPLGIAAVLIAVGVTGVVVYTQPAPRDEESLCLLPSPDGAATEPQHHVLVVDKTDKWNTAQGSRLRSVVIRMRDQLALNERLSIFVFDDAVEQGFPPVFSLCNPGRGSDTTILWNNPRRWEQQFIDRFGAPLDAILEDLALAAEGPISPILELLIDLSNREELNGDHGERRIVLVSDMLQNSDACSFFGQECGLSPESIDRMVELRGGLQNLHKFGIEVYQIRGVYPETKLMAARAFWDQVANHYGARIDWKVL